MNHRRHRRHRHRGHHRHRAVLALLALIIACLAGCRSGAPAPAFTALDDETTALRERFNADVGEVRVIMLVAPN